MTALTSLFQSTSCNNVPPADRGKCIRAASNSDVNQFLRNIEPDATAGAAEVNPELGFSLERMLDYLSYLSIPLAIAALVLIGIFVIGNVTIGDSRGAVKNLKRIVAVLSGLVLVFNAHHVIQPFI